MEKLLDTKDCKHYRVQCDCDEPGDAMDILVENAGNGKASTITMYFAERGLWARLKYAVEIMRGVWCWREFIVRWQDMAGLREIFDPDKKFSELP